MCEKELSTAEDTHSLDGDLEYQFRSPEGCNSPDASSDEELPEQDWHDGFDGFEQGSVKLKMLSRPVVKGRLMLRKLRNKLKKQETCRVLWQTGQLPMVCHI